MPRYYKRLGAGGKTKLSATRLGQLRRHKIKVTSEPERWPSREIPAPTRAKISAVYHKAIAHLMKLEEEKAPEKEIATALQRVETIEKIEKRILDEHVPIPPQRHHKFNLSSDTEREQLFRLLQKVDGGFYADLQQIGLRTKPIRRKGHFVFLSDFSQNPGLENQGSPGLIYRGMVFVDQGVPEPFRSIVVDHEIRESLLNSARYGDIRLKKRNFLRGHYEAVQREQRDLKRRNLLKPFLSFLKTRYPKTYADRIKAWKLNAADY